MVCPDPFLPKEHRMTYKLDNGFKTKPLQNDRPPPGLKAAVDYQSYEANLPRHKKRHRPKK